MLITCRPQNLPSYPYRQSISLNPIYPGFKSFIEATANGTG